MEKARRLAFVSPRCAELQSFEPPTTPAAGEYLLRISHSLISPGTELSMFRNAGNAPIFPGYTAVGIVTDKGQGADAAETGETVFVFPALDDSSHCHATHKRIAPGALVLPLPAGLPADRACFARMINVALTPFCHLGPHIRGWALVVGLGLVGNLAAQIARLKGFEVIGIEPDPARRERAQLAGINHLIDPGEGDAARQVRERTSGRGCMLTINATGRADTFPMAIEATADGGEMSTLGGARGPCDVDLSAFLRHVQFRHVTIRGGWEMLLPRHPASAADTPSTLENLEQAMDWLVNDTFDLDGLWTHRITPDEMPAAYQALDHADPRYMGVVVDWGSPPATDQ